MFLVRALFSLGTFILLGATLAGLALPRVIQVERSIEIAAPPDRIFPYINSQRMFVSWSPWSQRDTKAVYNVEGSESGPGSILTWRSSRPEILSGSQQIVESRQNEAVRHALNFEGLGEAQSLYELHQRGEKTIVRGRFAADLGPNPYMRLLGIMMEERVAADLNRGLWFLRDEIEQHRKQTDRAPNLAAASLETSSQSAVQ